jgi:hypothetical protein
VNPEPGDPNAVRSDWTQFAADFGLIVIVMLVYFFLRAAAPARIGFAVEVGDWLVQIERWLGVFREPEVQEWTLRWHWLSETANALYAYLHFPVLAGMGVVLWLRDRRRFVTTRNTIFVSMVIGLVFYYALPAAPPRLMAAHGYDYGFIDTVFGGDTAVRYVQPSFFINNYAALPSFHVGWMALSSAALWAVTRSRILRAGEASLTLVMVWATAATANHYFIDGVLGVAIVVVSWLVVRFVENRWRPGHSPGRWIL